MRPLIDGGGAVASSQDQPFPFEHAAGWMVTQVKSDKVFRPLVMTLSQDVVRHRNEFAFITGRTAALGKPTGDSRPKDIRFSIDHAVDIGTQIIVHLQGHSLAKGGIVFDVSKVIALSPDGSGSRLEQVMELLLLELIYPLIEAFHLSESWSKDEPGTVREKRHILSD